MVEMNKFKIISFYAFIHFDDLQFISEIIKNECKKSKIAGLVILAKERLSKLDISNVTIILGDGFLGYKNQAPFDRIIVSAAVEEIPKILIDQLKIDGIMVLPVGLPNDEQTLLKVTKKSKSLDIKEVLSVRFVQMLEGISKD